MKKPRVCQYLILIALAACLALANCGPDTTAPSDPASTSVIPDAVFFNGTSEQVLFQGRATDNMEMEEVLLSFDNGVTWKSADLDSTTPPNTARNVEWSYLASYSDIPAHYNTLIIRAVDAELNSSSSAPSSLARESGTSVAELQSVIAAAAGGDVIFLSTGSGDAFGDNATTLVLSPTSAVTIVGAGYGTGLTSGGVNPDGGSTSTVLESASDTSPLFSVTADLTLKELRLLGGGEAVRIDAGGADSSVTIEDCILDGQASWGVYAVDTDEGTTVELLSSLVDASSADSTTMGGLYLEEVTYYVSDSRFHGHADPGGPDDGAVTGAAIQTVAGTGQITDSLFTENAMSIWASGGSPVVTSCDVLGSVANSSFGINLSGGGGIALLRYNTIDGHSGYGIKIGGTTRITLRRNAITGNGQSGVLIDSRLPNGSLSDIDLGTGTGSEQGRNLFENNTHPDGNGAYDTQVYVTQATSEGLASIPANGNYWDYVTLGDIDLAIVDGDDQGGGRAEVAIGGFYTSKSEVGP